MKVAILVFHGVGAGVPADKDVSGFDPWNGDWILGAAVTESDCVLSFEPGSMRQGRGPTA